MQLCDYFIFLLIQQSLLPAKQSLPFLALSPPRLCLCHRRGKLVTVEFLIVFNEV